MGAVARRRLHRLGGGPVGRPGWVIRQGAYCVAIRGTAKGSPGNKRITVRQKYESPPHVMRSRWSGYFPASPKGDEPLSHLARGALPSPTLTPRRTSGWHSPRTRQPSFSCPPLDGL